jgi:hypothetical protein
MLALWSSGVLLHVTAQRPADHRPAAPKGGACLTR